MDNDIVEKLSEEYVRRHNEELEDRENAALKAFYYAFPQVGPVVGAKAYRHIGTRDSVLFEYKNVSFIVFRDYGGPWYLNTKMSYCIQQGCFIQDDVSLAWSLKNITEYHGGLHG